MYSRNVKRPGYLSPCAGMCNQQKPVNLGTAGGLVEQAINTQKKMRGHINVSDTWGTHPADERGCEALSFMGHHMKTPEIHQKSSNNYDLENETGDVWRLPKVSGVTRDGIRHH